MKLSKWRKKKLQRTITRMFGEDAVWDRKGDFCFVHLDGVDDEARQARIEAFDPGEFFDDECPHCRPFLEDGAIMVHTDGELVGIRLLTNGMVETVMLRRSLMAAAN